MAITIQIIGHKNSGKTSMTTALIKELTAAGYRVAAIKHDAHNGSMDIPGTDTAKMTLAGAQQVFLESTNGLFFHQQGPRPSLSAIVKFLNNYNDFVIIEGHKGAAYPKIVLLKDDDPFTDISNQSVIQAAKIVKAGRVDPGALKSIVNWTASYLIKQYERRQQQ